MLDLEGAINRIAKAAFGEPSTSDPEGAAAEFVFVVRTEMTRIHSRGFDEGMTTAMRDAATARHIAGAFIAPEGPGKDESQ